MHLETDEMQSDVLGVDLFLWQQDGDRFSSKPCNKHDREKGACGSVL